MTTRPKLAWIRNGNTSIQAHEIERIDSRFRVAVLQPWEMEAAAELKGRNPELTVLAYQCLSSVREYEPGPIYSSGLSPQRAKEMGYYYGRTEWEGYPGHYQQRVWDPEYRKEWADTVAQRFKNTAFDGVMADNDVYDDYYNIGFPLEDGTTVAELRNHLSRLITVAGRRMREENMILVPNIAEARRQAGRWRRHSRFGGGMEECLLGWGLEKEQRLSVDGCLSQMPTLRSRGLSIARVPGNSEPGDPNLELALATAWVFAPTSDVAVTATAHDDYDGLPETDSASWDLGKAQGKIQAGPQPGVFGRAFERGRAIVNLSDDIASFNGTVLLPYSGVIFPL